MVTRKLIRYLTRMSAVVLMLALMWPQSAAAQSNDDLNVYGFFQSQYTYAKEYNDDGSTSGYSSFITPQLNVFFAKDIGSSFTAFVNTEFLNNFNSEENWGMLRLGEAWVRYDYGSALKVKGGLLIPKFNNLNEIKNRTPLLPYVYRPLVYEQSNTMFNNANYVPQRAYVQVYGALPMGDAQFDYAAYVGNSDAEYIANGGDESFRMAGTDTTFAKLFGGRVGLRYQSLKVGVSGTIDETNMRQLDFFGVSTPLGLGDVDRYRIGVDLSFDIADFFVEGEYISVMHSMDDDQEAQWTTLSENSPMASFLGEDLDQSFYYGMVGYQITDKFGVNTLYNVISNNRMVGLDEGAAGLSGGISYRPVFPVLLKANFTRAWLRADNDDFTSNMIMVAASVSF